ncbi:Uncharacterised protein [Chryseobacterium taklimakanense]|uniref:Uncharacterized protein n=1 Tax=Chryseobacterium taklimakanense TaxID=536441 RepID=A0A239WNS5_9FLAO|nr:hypothetical protein [Chryseobacterium taklimakanense]SNV35750.1 Uncharacterised protein [Chryseobacterium taklimakanense]
MTKFQKSVTFITSIIATIGFSIWLYNERTYEPAIGLIISLGGIISSLTVNKKYKNRRIKGEIKFDYSNNNGIYIIGENELTFETKWSKASDQSIHLYNDPNVISGIAIANSVYDIENIKDASQYDFSSRSRTVEKHGIAVLKNKYGNYAVIKILEIKDNSRGALKDELHFKYLINPDGKTDFS